MKSLFLSYSVNSEFLTPLDVAVMTNNIPMAKMLLSNGARESPLCKWKCTLPVSHNILYMYLS